MNAAMFTEEFTKAKMELVIAAIAAVGMMSKPSETQTAAVPAQNTAAQQMSQQPYGQMPQQQSVGQPPQQSVGQPPQQSQETVHSSQEHINYPSEQE